MPYISLSIDGDIRYTILESCVINYSSLLTSNCYMLIGFV